ncbi:uncharacterized protein LOC123523127 [Mercenaria mercenaria]|uniref:uncharacterized protein LOC123523127 n=1 Tax=Mercenaria mercenaria TaxID=6596 RepID=UPI00234F5F96|nr:uncharacterized protein LOC123523127 [Mercenaria mercenaria]
MFQQPGYIENVSEKLSEVLADIGVDERIVLKRRRSWLLGESVMNRSLQLQDLKVTHYYLGSQPEGTTTLGLSSDYDLLICNNNYNIIQDWKDWQPGMVNLLKIQDATVSPGYCLLQRLRNDAPLPCNFVPDVYFVKDRTGRILLWNGKPYLLVASFLGEGVRHGPAFAQQRRPATPDNDFVLAFHCKTWPLQARQWLDQQGVGQWPSDDMRRYCSNTGCFVVGVGSKGSENEETEWRISTSLAERCLMLNLNITQIRCYVLMKMILKTYIKPQFEDTISSYMCKTVLFHCIANKYSDIWRENNLIICLSLQLLVLHNFILHENCPHFLLPDNNLMRAKISTEIKPSILDILQYVINSEGTALLGIKCDDLGSRLQLKFNNLRSLKTGNIISAILLKTTAQSVFVSIQHCVIRNNDNGATIRNLLKFIFDLVSSSNQCQGFDRTACRLLAPWFCTTLGSVLASLNIQQFHGISPEALTWISLGLNTDVASSKLKLASMYFCIGDYHRTETALRDIEGKYDQNIVQPVCNCHFSQQGYINVRGFNEISDTHIEEALQHTAAFCVTFLTSEIKLYSS